MDYATGTLLLFVGIVFLFKLRIYVNYWHSPQEKEKRRQLKLLKRTQKINGVK